MIGVADRQRNVWCGACVVCGHVNPGPNIYLHPSVVHTAVHIAARSVLSFVDIHREPLLGYFEIEWNPATKPDCIASSASCLQYCAHSIPVTVSTTN